MEHSARTETGRERKREAALKAWEQECRRRWRVMREIILAKLEAIACGVTTLEQEFVAFMALPDGQTIGQRFIPQLQKILAGQVQSLLPGVEA